MARQRARKAFPGEKRTTSSANGNEQMVLSTERSGAMGFLSDRGVRETFESILIAIVLALLFRTFEAEAFVIPTGSMAPSLQGQHRDINCEKCNYLYQTGASEESWTQPKDKQGRITHTFCPICQFRTKMDSNNVNHNSNTGDRILVNKFAYDFNEPKRFDVIVFKNPNNGKQNYIKRLIGLPNESIVIENGDIYLIESSDDGTTSRTIIRKPAHKLKPMLQLVDDTDFIPEDLHKAGWPLRWQQWDRQDGVAGWENTVNSGKPNYVINETPGTTWLRYRHLIPIVRIASSRTELNEWDQIEKGELPERMKTSDPLGRLIGDYYCYNHRKLKQSRGTVTQEEYDQSLAMHWVGDLGMEVWSDVKSESGTIKVQLVEGGVKFTCSIDIATGEASLDANSENITFRDSDDGAVERPTGKTKIKGSGKYRILFANVDDRLYLSVNNQFVEFDAADYDRTDQTLPKFPNKKHDRGDAEPAGFGAEKANVEVTRFKILRDVYYTSPKELTSTFPLGNENQFQPVEQVWRWFDNPETWESQQAVSYFQSRFRDIDDANIYQLNADQFLPMGDNSPQSLDGRVWPGPKYVPRDMLIGRALFIYWPHGLHTPIPMVGFPNFKKMGFIR